MSGHRRRAGSPFIFLESPRPYVTLSCVAESGSPLQTTLDTVIINMDERLLILIWRAFVAVRNGPHDLVSAEVVSDVAVSTPGGV